MDRLFLHLFEEQPDFAEHPPTFAPRLARNWTWSADHLILDVELEPDVRWSDGLAVTAEDVRWTWLAQRHPEVAWRYAEIKKNIKNVRVLGLHHFAVEYATESPSQLAELNEGVILPRHAWSALPFAEWPRGAAWFRDHLVTNGPFELAGWESQQRIELRRNPEYFEPDRPYLSSVVLRVVPLRANRLAELEAGKADFVSQLVPAEVRRLEGQPGITIRQFWHRQYDYLAWNLRRPQFAQASVRRALTQAIDRQALVDTVWDGRARIGTSPILASVWAHHPDLEPWPYDLSAARDALLIAGWQADKNGVLRRAGRPFELELLVNSANPIHVDSAVLIQTQLARVGIEVAVRRLDFHALIDRLDSGDFDGAIGSWGIDTSLDLGYAFHSRSITEGYNSGAYAEPTVDRLIEAAREETDQDARREILYRLQEILHRDQPYAFLWEPPRFDAHSTRLRGVGSNPLSSLFRLREWRVGHD
ncbi:MAG: ABC transporter substrate-binding protein [Acidobacteria bacterium]|nr:ABC transporter substrate-binding protein [Acidobacteriota bacterium]